MGWGDSIIGSGLARGAARRHKRVAFGDGTKIRWDQFAEPIYRGNPNVAPPGSERAPHRLEWVEHYKGNRLYNKSDGTRWVWNYDFKVTPGEVFLARMEKMFADQIPKGYVLIEPNVPSWKSVAPNKQWPVYRYEEVAAKLRRAGYQVRQMVYGSQHRLHNATPVLTEKFRQALAVMQRADLYIGPEGGLHHGAAAVGTPAVVLFGGFVPPSVTGYDTHTNLTGGAEACGSFSRCEHCIAAMNRIGVDEVVEAALEHLERRAA